LVIKTNKGMQQKIISVGEVKNNELSYTFKWDNPYLKNGLHMTLTINVDTLNRKCKEWCNEKKYIVRTEIHYSNSIILQLLNFNHSTRVWEEPCRTTFETEVEASIKAVQWVNNG